MKKFLLSILSLVIISSSGFSQKRTLDPLNTRPGENFEFCRQHKMLNELKKNPLAAQRLAADEIIRQQELANPQPKAAGTIYYIPVVFHILHMNGSENVSDDEIYDALRILNEDFSGSNPEIGSVDSEFVDFIDTAHIQFRLATIAPDGTCFKGITRTQTALTFDGSNGTAQLNAVVSGNDVYNGQWPGNEYMNVFVADDIGGAGGYTYTPNNWIGTAMNNGIWILENLVVGHTMAHEVGHWVNLSHTWGGSNTPGVSGNCNDDDGVQDTPVCVGTSGCNINNNSCTGDNAYWGYNKKDNVENFMEYSFCFKMFTKGQGTRMRNALNSSVGGRNNVWTTSNLATTGADGNIYLCTAQFSSDKTSVCVGDQVQFTDESFNVVNGWTWSFPGADVTSSTAQNPTATYSAPGLYQVSLTATDGTNNDSEVKVNYIRVLPLGATLPVVEGFESYSTFTGIDEWEVINTAGNGFVLATNAGLGSLKCAKLANFAQPSGNVDELVSAPVDLSGVASVGSMTLSFRHAFKRRATTNDDRLKIQITADCGDTWITRKTIPSQILSSDIYPSVFTPNDSSDWTTVHVTNILSTYWVDNLRYRFEFTAGGGNNLFIDNINLYTGAPSEELVVGLEENLSINNLSVYPNPADNELNVRFSIDNAQETVIAIQDVTGKMIQSNLIKANSGQNLVMMDTAALSSGMYFMSISTAAGQKTIQFIIK
ncbi:MAG: T9SS type A sorting domain-containing protein [Fluviicola sp.]|nr:T9SS type A sorting domain-containing protein [Fluviicola sp.]